MFGSNLRLLARDYPSISELSRQLGINRTQFNRYLSGESFPRPDVLARICDFFSVDARVLLEPVDQIQTATDPMSGPFLRHFIGEAVSMVPQQFFPSGFYRFSRRSFLENDRYVVGLVRVHRDGQLTYVRGYEARAAIHAQGLPMTRAAREFRGLMFRQEDGVAALISRRGARTASFNFLAQVSSFEQNYWVGYAARTVREVSDGQRIVRMVYEHLGHSIPAARAAVKTGGYCSVEDLLPFHQRLLQPDEAFR